MERLNAGDLPTIEVQPAGSSLRSSGSGNGDGSGGAQGHDTFGCIRPPKHILVRGKRLLLDLHAVGQSLLIRLLRNCLLLSPCCSGACSVQVFEKNDPFYAIHDDVRDLHNVSIDLHGPGPIAVVRQTDRQANIRKPQPFEVLLGQLCEACNLCAFRSRETMSEVVKTYCKACRLNILADGGGVWARCPCPSYSWMSPDCVSDGCSTNIENTAVFEAEISSTDKASEYIQMRMSTFLYISSFS